MNKILLISILLLSTLNLYAQSDTDNWQLIEVTDKFDRGTGEFIAVLTFNGTFSDSATTGSLLVGRIIVLQKAIMLDFFKYGKFENSIDYERLIMNAIDSNGKEWDLGNPYFYYSGKRFKELLNLLCQGGEIRFVARPLYYGHSPADIKFSINANDLNDIKDKITVKNLNSYIQLD